jgi:hypothetical protein
VDLERLAKRRTGRAGVACKAAGSAASVGFRQRGSTVGAKNKAWDFSIASILALDGVTNGAIYALLALATVLVFAVTR